jgi:hypothetical protein
MAFIVEFDPIAEKEYFEAWDWYENELTGLGDRFGNSVSKQIEVISKSPLIYPNKKANSRECKIEDFPYLVVYKIYPAKNFIYITSIFHTSRNPRKKYGK